MGTLILASFNFVWFVLILLVVPGSNYDKFKANGIRTEAKILSMEKLARVARSTKLKWNYLSILTQVW